MGPAGRNKHPHPLTGTKTHPEVIFWECKQSASKENWPEKPFLSSIADSKYLERSLAMLIWSQANSIISHSEGRVAPISLTSALQWRAWHWCASCPHLMSSNWSRVINNCERIFRSAASMHSRATLAPSPPGRDIVYHGWPPSSSPLASRATTRLNINPR